MTSTWPNDRLMAAVQRSGVDLSNSVSFAALGDSVYSARPAFASTSAMKPTQRM